MFFSGVSFTTLACACTCVRQIVCVTVPAGSYHTVYWEAAHVVDSLFGDVIKWLTQRATRPSPISTVQVIEKSVEPPGAEKAVEESAASEAAEAAVVAV